MIFQAQAKSAKQATRSGFVLLVAFSAFGLTMTGTGIYKASASTSQLTVDAVVVGTILIDCTTQELNFGEIIPSGVAGTVVVDTASGATDGGGATYVIGSGAASGLCTVEGNASVPYEIDYVVSDLTGPGVDMTLTSLESDNANGPFFGLGTHTGNLDGAGEDTLVIGATLNVGANQAGGNYTGTIEVTVDYP